MIVARSPGIESQRHSSRSRVRVKYWLTAVTVRFIMCDVIMLRASAARRAARHSLAAAAEFSEFGRGNAVGLTSIPVRGQFSF